MDYLKIKTRKRKRIIVIIILILISIAFISYNNYTFSKYEAANRDDGSLLVTIKDEYKHKITKLKIPDYLHGKKITYVILDDMSVEKLELPKEVEKIEIRDCTNLSEIIMPEKLVGRDKDTCFIRVEKNNQLDYEELTNLTMIVKKGSEAEEYAKKHNIAIQYK